MVKKKNDSSVKPSFLDSIIDMGKKKVNSVVEDYIRTNITQKLMRVGEMSLALILGSILVLVGLGQFIASQIAFLENGLNYIVLGVVLLIIAYFLS